MENDSYFKSVIFLIFEKFHNIKCKMIFFFVVINLVFMEIIVCLVFVNVRVFFISV